MSGINTLGSESTFVLGGCGFDNCDSCPQMLCPDDLLGRGMKSNRVVSSLGEDIKEIFVADKGDNL